MLLWRAVVRHGLTRRRTVLHPFGVRVSRGFLGGLGTGTGGRLFTGPAADALAGAQRSALRAASPAQDAAADRLAALQFATCELEKRLSPLDRALLRDCGDVPDWFPAELKARAEQIRKQRLRSTWV